MNSETTTCQWCEKEALADYPLCSCQENRQIAWEQCGLPKRLWTACLEQMLPPVRTAVLGWLEDHREGCGLWLRGPAGLGKSMALGYICRVLTKEKAQRVKYVNMVELYQRLKEGFSVDEDKDRLREYTDCPLLLLDDMGKEQVTDWKEEVIYYLIDHRYSALRPTFIATNMGGDQIAAHYPRSGQYIMDRIREQCTPVVLKGASMRGGSDDRP